MTKIKICGLRTLADIEAVNEAMPDYVGFIFAPSKRQITLEEGVTLCSQLDSKIKTVGVFVNESKERIVEIQKACNLDVIQLHGNESNEFCRDFEGTVWKAISIKEPEDLEKVNTFNTEAVVLDTYHPNMAGGSGMSFAWQWLETHPFNKEWVLAGGISIENVYDALQYHPTIVDISSGVETDGKKDRKKIIEFVRKVRAYAL